MRNIINQNELLYRAIKRSKPEWFENEKPTPAMFKETGGNSVDRDGGREESEIIRFMNEETFPGRLKGVVRLSAGECMSGPNAVKVVADPSKDNPYHANIFLCENDIFKYDLQALKLSDISTVVYINQNMDWVET